LKEAKGHHMYPVKKNRDIFSRLVQTKRSLERSIPKLESSGQKSSFNLKSVRKLAIEHSEST
jgi:hypothetical protein